MSRSTLSPMALPLRRFAASACVFVLLAATSAVPGIDVFTPAAAAGPWDQMGADIDGAAPGDQSGFSVAISDDGTRLAVGAIRDDDTYGGYVRVFRWSGAAWQQLGPDIDAETAADESGFSVSLSSDGNRLAVGARLNGDSANLAGHVRVLQWSGSAWQQLGADIDGEAEYEQSGYSVALSDDGSRLAVGAPGASTNRGLVRVFAWSGSEWNQLGEPLSGAESYDTAGWSVALSADGSRVAVGTPGNDESGSNAGRVSVFAWSGSAWTTLGSVDGEAEGDFSGRSVSLSADGARLAVGATKNDDGGSDAGHVRVYSWSGSTWVQLGPDVDGETENDQSGRSVALSADGARLAVGASGVGAGLVRVYLWSGSAWVQLGTNIDGEADADRFGTSVALTADGGAVAVGAIRNDGTGENAGHVRVQGSLTPSPEPGPPLDVTGVAANSQVTVSWSAPIFGGGSAITSYTATASPGGAACSAPGTLSCTVTGLENGTSYTFAVTATNTFGTGPASGPPGSLTPATLPDAPLTTAASLTGDGEVLVWWSPPLFDGGAAITEYNAAASPGTATCSTSGALSCIVTGLDTSVPHTFTVTATNGIGTGPASPPSVPVVAAVPGPPSRVTAASGDGEAWVTWAAPIDDGASAITQYTATAVPGGATCSTVGELSCIVTQLTNGVPHTFTVTATNSIGTGFSSLPSSPVTPAIPISVPDAPQDVLAAAGDLVASVSWSAPTSDGGSAPTGYTATATPGGASCSTTDTLSCDVTGLVNGTSYTFTVTAVNSVGTSPASSPSSPVTPAAVPSAPLGAFAAAGNAQASVAWSVPAADGGLPVTGYTVTASPGGATCTTTGAISCDVTGLANGTTYTFAVAATNSVGTGLESIGSNPITPTGPATTPGAPTGISATAGNGTATVSWSTPISDGGSSITGYEATATPGGRSCATSGSLSCTVTGLTNDVTYTFTVAATNIVGTGPASTPSNPTNPSAGGATTGGQPPPCPSPAVPFDDIDTVISRNDIACIYGLGITTGTATTKYSPNNTVDRNQMASFLARLWRALGDS